MFTLRQRPSAFATDLHVFGRCWPPAAIDFLGAHTPVAQVFRSFDGSAETRLAGTQRAPAPHVGNVVTSTTGGPS
jgi:hypothetical protein